MQHYQFQLIPGHTVEPVPLLTLLPKGGMPMVVTARETVEIAY
jgi:hypothetical protein